MCESTWCVIPAFWGEGSHESDAAITGEGRVTAKAQGMTGCCFIWGDREQRHFTCFEVPYPLKISFWAKHNRNSRLT